MYLGAGNVTQLKIHGSFAIESVYQVGLQGLNLKTLAPGLTETGGRAAVGAMGGRDGPNFSGFSTIWIFGLIFFFRRVKVNYVIIFSLRPETQIPLSRSPEKRFSRGDSPLRLWWWLHWSISSMAMNDRG